MPTQSATAGAVAPGTWVEDFLHRCEVFPTGHTMMMWMPSHRGTSVWQDDDRVHTGAGHGFKSPPSAPDLKKARFSWPFSLFGGKS